MTKKKGNKSADAPADSAAPKAGQINPPSRAISLFPAKPVRSNQAPGVAVRLITNLFKISLKQEKPIYRYTIEIEQLDSPASQGDAKKPALPRKIHKDVRQAVVKNAVANWLKNNDSARKFSGAFNYVLDGNASTMFALFDMPLTAVGKNKSKLEVKVVVSLPFISDGKLVQEEKSFQVKFHDGSILKVRELLDYCSGKGVHDTERYKDHVRALNVIFLGEIVQIPRYLVGESSKSLYGSVYPFDRQKQFPISQGVICNKGFNLSVRPTEKGLVLNVANTNTPFYEPLKLLDLLKNRFGVRDFKNNLSPRDRELLEKELTMKQVEAIHINYGTKDKPHFRKYRVQSISKTSTLQQQFEMNGKKMSVFDYFKMEYPKVTLMYPNLPCIVAGSRYIPIEVCRIVDRQRVMRKMTPDETSEMIKKAALKPEFHFKEVQANVQEMKAHNKSYENFGLQLDINPIEVTGRELPQICLLGEGQKPANTMNGEYQNRNKFVKSAVVGKWCVLVIADDTVTRCYANPTDVKKDGREFAQMYARTGQMKGVTVDSTEVVDTIQFKYGGEDDFRSTLTKYFDHLNSQKFALCITVLPSRVPEWTYSFLQYLEASASSGRTKDEKRTRVCCLKFENYHRKILREQQDFKRQMFLNNLWLKHNTKLGGVNMVLSGRQNFGIDSKTLTPFLSPGYLFVSIDVCHPAPNDRLKQSVAAVVGMWNITNPNMAYCTRLRVQRKDKSDQDKSTVEEVGQVGIMFAEILESYKQQTGKLAENVVVLRDGVSEGQFKMVLEKELCQIKQVLYNTYSKLKVKEPKLACLTVQKRHRIRFMRKDPVKDRRGNNDYNIQPGTVVDAEITTPNDFSFYLAPHKAIQGTARAPHIFMIYDEIKFSQDSAQAMIFALSYLSPRCTKGTSIPTPVNLADLAAERGKNVVVSWNEVNAAKKIGDDERLCQLNAFLSNLGETNYKNTLFYI